jgi:hypothetical protein
MVMIDLGHEKKSLGVISVTQVTETLRSSVAEPGDVQIFTQVTGPGVRRRSVSSALEADAKR